MTIGTFDKTYSLIFAISLFAGVVFHAGISCAQEEQMGITVSAPPGPVSIPGESLRVRTVWIVPVFFGGLVAVILSGGVILMKKRRIRQPVPQTNRPAVDLKEKSAPPSDGLKKPVNIPSPVRTTPQPPSAQPLPKAPPERPPLPHPVPQQPVKNPPPSSQVQVDSKPPVDLPLPELKPASPAPPPAEASQRLNPEEDVLFKHLDLLKQLKNKENK